MAHRVSQDPQRGNEGKTQCKQSNDNNKQPEYMFCV